MKSKRNKAKVLMLLFVLVGVVFMAKTSLLINAWFILTEPEYLIPQEASLFLFNPTVMNPGSGDWWIYGEDKNNFYYFSGNESLPYEMISRKSSQTCDRFSPHKHKTWRLCQEKQ